MPSKETGGPVVERSLHVGDFATVKRLHGAQVYSVPDEIPDGAKVRLVGFQPGYFDVDYNGKQFLLFMGCLKAITG